MYNLGLGAKPTVTNYRSPVRACDYGWRMTTTHYIVKEGG
jgi:hypothetical protein